MTLFPSAVMALSFVACAPPDESEGLRPSLTQVRTGEASVSEEEMPVIPEDLYIPGIVIKGEDYDYPSDDTRRRGSARKTDLSRMSQHDDPVALDKHVTELAAEGSIFSYTVADGELYDIQFEKELEYTDVEQGAIGDCYLAAAFSSVLYADKERWLRPGLIREVEDKDGYVTGFAVRFYDAWGEPQDVVVDADLLRKTGKPVYIRSMDSRPGEEEWGLGLMEKAYAQWHGGYEKIGNGGWAGDVMQALSGAKASYRQLSNLTDSSLKSQIRASVDAGRPIVAGTFGKDDGVNYDGTNIYAWHAYSVLDESTEDGKLFIHLRNPWGEVEPAGNGDDDGIFKIEVSEFRRLYKSITFGGGYKDDVKAPATVTTLTTQTVSEGTAILTFTSVGDDDKEGLAATYDVRWSTQPITDATFAAGTPVPMASPQAPATQETVQIDGLPNDGIVFVALKVIDESGNTSKLSNVAEVVLERLEEPVGTEQTFDFEDGLQGWEATGLFHHSDIFSASGSWSVWFGDDQAGSYDTGARVTGTLTSPPIALNGLQDPKLVFSHLLDVEAGDEYDKAWVEVAAAGSNDWTTVWSKEPPVLDFVVRTVDLGPFEGQTVQIRFSFDSVDEQSNGGFGWFVDDVKVLAGG